MRKPFLTTISLCALLLIPAVGPSLARAATNCQDLLANNSYRCQVNDEIHGQFETCFQFVSPGVAGTKFDLVDDETGDTLECECKATGSVKNPKFNASKAFLCGHAGSGDAVEGKVSGNGKNIAKGQFFFNDDPDESWVFECVLDPACHTSTLTTGNTKNSHRR